MPAWLPAWKAPGASSGHHISAPLSWMEPREAGAAEEGREKGLWAASCQIQPWAALLSLSHWVDQEFAVPIKLCAFTPPGSCSCCLRPLPGPSGRGWHGSGCCGGPELQAGPGGAQLLPDVGSTSLQLPGDDLEVSSTNHCCRNTGHCSEASPFCSPATPQRRS